MMTNTSNFNRFTYVIGADDEIEDELISWINLAEEYINQYFEGDRSRINKTIFGDCVSKIEVLAELFIYDDNYLSDFRGVRDIGGRLQAGAVISEQIGELYPYTKERKYLSIDPFTTPPWNCLKLEGIEFSEKKKGAATWLMAEIIQETIDTEIEGVTKVLAIDRARNFYLDMGFEENPEYSRELILTREAAIIFLEEQLNRRRNTQ
ncbi:MAG: GNAT family N-acetyltransferase [Cyanobacteria bacterium J06573_2]